MKIDRHISELLHDHDCVIVPSFGGFLGSYQPSQLQPVQHTFYPPSKKIAFNVFLKNNDGLLANHIAHKNKITYAEALKNIERFRMDAIRLLESGKQITVENVGTLFYDKNKNLQFEPAKHINYLEEAFGLAAIQSPPVKREEQRKKLERRIREAGALRSSMKPLRTASNGKRTSVKKILNTLTLAGALVWFSFNVYVVVPHKVSVSSLNPFSYASSPEKGGALADDSKKENVKNGSAPAKNPKLVVSVDRLFPYLHHSVATTNPPTNKATASLASVIENQKNFFIIAGVFKEPGNAEKLVESLKQQGFTKAEIVNPTAPVKKVCYSSFAFRKDAEDALTQLHAAKKDGWILAR